jgi:hypothetical protein
MEKETRWKLRDEAVTGVGGGMSTPTEDYRLAAGGMVAEDKGIWSSHSKCRKSGVLRPLSNNQQKHPSGSSNLLE